MGICVNYDGYDTVEGLKGLIDDIQDYARRARDGEIMRKSTEQAKKEERNKEKERMDIIDTWKCPNCGFVYSGLQIQALVNAIAENSGPQGRGVR